MSFYQLFKFQIVLYFKKMFQIILTCCFVQRIWHVQFQLQIYLDVFDLVFDHDLKMFCEII